jgi:uncharacterized protein YtpQ (UPF0354 family)
MDNKSYIKKKLILLVLITGAGIVGISFNWFKGRFFQNRSIEQLWTAKSVTPGEFTRLYVSLFKEMAPDYSLKIVGPMEIQIKAPGNDCEFKNFLDNAYNESQSDIEARKEICTRYISSFIKSSSVVGISSVIDPNKIIPVIKDQRYIHNFPSDKSSDKPLVYENLIADIYIVYAIDEEGYIRFLVPEELKDMNLSNENLKSLAMNNLQNNLPDTALLKFDKGYVVETDHQNEASLLLFDEFWKHVQQKIDGHIIAAVPSRSMLIFTTLETDGGIVRLKELARQISENESYLISETLLIRQNGKWEVFQEEGK